MFDTAELGHTLTKEELRQREGPLRESLLEGQHRLKEARTPVFVVISGADASGKGDTVNSLMEWLDPRGVRVHALQEDTDEERERPEYWRWWRRLPARGQVGIYLGSWYTKPIVRRVLGEIKARQLDEDVQDITSFEKQLIDDGALVVKFWLHLSRKDQKKKLKSLESDPLTRWRVTKDDWRSFELYDKFREISEHVLKVTSTGPAPWHVVDASDAEYRNLRVLQTLDDRIRAHLDAVQGQQAPRPIVTPLPPDERGILSTLDHSLTVAPDEYKRRLRELQAEINRRARRASRRGRSTVVVFEGMDASGKGGAIRRLTAAIDVRDYLLVPVAAPTDEEKAHPYMWRFWRQIPRQGRVTIFDRSWYGRILVEPIEGFCSRAEWERAYKEINDFEDYLDRHGTQVIKFWLSVTKDEQLKRFQEREQVGHKRYKITQEDWRNRDKWELYEAMVHRMVERTSTSSIPWHVIPANDKLHARIAVLETMCERLE